MAKRPINGLLPGVGLGQGQGQGGPRDFPPPGKLEFDEFDIDLRFGIGGRQFDLGDLDLRQQTGCLCLGGTDIDTVGGATCVQLCLATHGKLCLSNFVCGTYPKATCFICETWRTCYKVTTCLPTHNQDTCHTCDCPTQGGNECG